MWEKYYMSAQKLTNNKQNIIQNVLFSFIFLLAALSFQWPETFRIGPIQINNLLTGLIIFLISYFLVFENFKKSSGFLLKLLFAVENICFLLIGLGVIFQSYIQNDNLRVYFDISYIIYYIVILHSMIELYIDYLNKQSNSLCLKFSFYLSLLCLVFFLLGKKYQATEQMTKLLAIVFAICFVIYFVRVILYFTNKKNKNTTLKI
ncbi:hypothetical protein [Candidatus Phytoplasma phoenicium]|uniref:Putative integral membrane protein n=1 Tax=Candidatus Phytoplasma phoenicium TaxID=198422 RepID=A0A0L0MJU5_9MOLU|nr:hypothetical protein [Candidatus Phytoplasma phoenicium]KND62623.1 putative integral membrane protein [Candidatus Phytoplasma phoenicium]